MVTNNLLTKQGLEEIENHIASFKVPSDVGRLPAQISSNYGAFIAKQWKNWILIYSPVVLKGLLPSEHMGCWLLFVCACRAICLPLITTSDVESSHMFFLQFCKRVEELYGKEVFNPNLHLNMHLKECFMDYGPAHAFWCFSFERYNGILGSYHTNKRDVESQFMRNFLTQQAVQSLHITPDNPLHGLLPPKGDLEGSVCSSVLNFCKDSSMTLEALHLHEKKIELVQSFTNNGFVVPLPPFRRSTLDAEEVQPLTMLYTQIKQFITYHTFINSVAE